MNTNRRWLELALKGLMLERNRIDEEIAEIKKELRTGSSKQPAELQESVAPPVRKRNRLSAAGRRAISVGMKRRWAARRNESAKKAAKVRR